MRTVFARRCHALALAACLAAALVLPSAGYARPIDSFSARLAPTAPATPRSQAVAHSDDGSLAVAATAGVLALALASAGYAASRRRPQRSAR